MPYAPRKFELDPHSRQHPPWQTEGAAVKYELELLASNIRQPMPTYTRIVDRSGRVHAAQKSSGRCEVVWTNTSVVRWRLLRVCVLCVLTLLSLTPFGLFGVVSFLCFVCKRMKPRRRPHFYELFLLRTESRSEEFSELGRELSFMRRSVWLELRRKVDTQAIPLACAVHSAEGKGPILCLRSINSLRLCHVCGFN